MNPFLYAVVKEYERLLGRLEPVVRNGHDSATEILSSLLLSEPSSDRHAETSGLMILDEALAFDRVLSELPSVSPGPMPDKDRRYAVPKLTLIGRSVPEGGYLISSAFGFAERPASVSDIIFDVTRAAARLRHAENHGCGQERLSAADPLPIRIIADYEAGFDDELADYDFRLADEESRYLMHRHLGIIISVTSPQAVIRSLRRRLAGLRKEAETSESSPGWKDAAIYSNEEETQKDNFRNTFRHPLS